MQLVELLRAGFPAVFMVTHEETRALRVITQAANAVGRQTYVWTVANGIQDLHGQVISADATEPDNAAQWLMNTQDATVLVMMDAHHFLGGNPYIIRRFKILFDHAKTSRKTVVFVGYTYKVAPDLERFIPSLPVELPSESELGEVLDALLNGAKTNPEQRAAAIQAARGLTTPEAEDAFAYSLSAHKALVPEVIAEIKCNSIKRQGLLELIERHTPLENIGGLENLKSALVKLRRAFTKEAREFGVRPPKGWLVVGQPGTGKSLTARAAGAALGIPLVRLEAGRLFGSLVGESEANWRRVMELAKAVAPCVLWIDEVDGLFAGHGGPQLDSGVTARVLKAILQDIQEENEIFYFFTANDIDRLPDPLLDRLLVWSVELPNADERTEILSVHLRMAKRNPKKFDIPKLVAATNGFSGRQIEAAVHEALVAAFDEGKELADRHIVAAAAAMVPAAVANREAIEVRRAKLQGRARPANAQAQTVTQKKTRALC